MVDNTHVDVEARKKFVDAAKAFPCLKAVRCFLMNSTHEQARQGNDLQIRINIYLHVSSLLSRHNNLFRELTGSAGQHAKIKEPLFHAYK